MPLKASVPWLFSVAASLDSHFCGGSELSSCTSVEDCSDHGSKFSQCCKADAAEPGVLQRCWHGNCTYDSCCLPELLSLLQKGMRLMDDGAFRAASHLLLDLWNNYAIPSSGVDIRNKVFFAFEKAASKVRNALEAEPHSLTFYEVFFRGMNVKCKTAPTASTAQVGGEKAGADHSQTLSPYGAWRECCGDFFWNDNTCVHIFEMMANALGHRHRDAHSQDFYYSGFSESWAFHHFTPSILESASYGDVDLHQVSRSSYSFDRELFEVLSATEEPTDGILWSEHIPGYMSPKYQEGVAYLTRLLGAMRQSGASLAIDLFEIGGGYGNLARLLASARPRLEMLSKPIHIRRCTILDVQFAIDLQRWYLNKTVGHKVELRDWSTGMETAVDALGWDSPAGALSLWPEATPSASMKTDTLQVDFVSREYRDVFAHLAGAARTAELHALELAGGQPPAKALIAVNSWHEFPMAEFLWFHRHFVSASLQSTGADWILYVSDQTSFTRSSGKESLLLQPQAHYTFEVVWEECIEVECRRLLKRV